MHLGLAYLIAISLFAVDERTNERVIPNADALEGSLYYTISEKLDMPDDRKADLYARLAETLTEHMKFSHAVSTIQNELMRGGMYA